MNGYRGELYKQLSAAGANVEYVGSQRTGNFGKTNHEGYPGYTISQISAKADKALTFKPNVVCLMAGTNDMAWASKDPKPAAKRLKDLVLKITNTSPNAVVLVATLTPLTMGGQGGKGGPLAEFNSQIPIIAKELASQNKKVAVADMSAVNQNELKDGVHPNDVGYSKMATAWFKAIENAAQKGWITEPAA
jgi:lysophospholipase L1-like esterase